MYKLHFGPGDSWIKPSKDWLTIDIDPKRAHIVINLNSIERIPFEDESVECIYASHIFEHIDIFHSPIVFRECFRILKKNGFMRIVLPDVRKSIEQYLNGNAEYKLFKRRIEFLKKRFGYEKITLFEALKCDFISPTGQPDLLGCNSLAHQNAWDYESLVCDLCRAGFEESKIKKMAFRKTDCKHFEFEGTYPSEANEYDRSLYVEVRK